MIIFVRKLGHSYFQPMKQYKTIFLDWDDTIGDFRYAADKALREMYVLHRLNRFFPDYDSYYSVYHEHNLSLWEKYEKQQISKTLLHFDRFYYPLSVATADMPTRVRHDIQQMAIAMGSDFLHLTSVHFRLLDGAEDAIRYLASKYPLTIVSNGFVEVQYEKINLSGLQSCFSHIVLSEEVGAQKPNPEIFRYALLLNKCQSQDALMIGDSYPSDIQGAINAGIDQLWLTDRQPSAQTPCTYQRLHLKDAVEML